jgi:hypothetical protein
MSKQRKFNVRRFFDGFHGHEDALADLFTHFGRTLPDPFTTETAARAASEDFGLTDPMTTLFYQIHDLASPKGRDIIHSTSASFELILGAGRLDRKSIVTLWGQSPQRHIFPYKKAYLFRCGD